MTNEIDNENIDNENKKVESLEPAKSDDRIDRLESKVDSLIETVGKIVSGGTSKDDPPETKDDEGPEIPPQIDIDAAVQRAIKPERGPAPTHFLFKRIGRR